MAQRTLEDPAPASPSPAPGLEATIEPKTGLITMARRQYTEEQKAEALDLYSTTGPTAVQKKLGIPKATVASWARRTGVQTVRNEKTHAATQAASIDAAATRQLVASNTIDAARLATAKIRERLATEAGEMPLKDLSIVAGVLIDKHAVLTRMDADANEHSAVDDWLEHMIGGGGE